MKRPFGAAASTVAVRPAVPWYWRVAGVLLLVFVGYIVCYWQLAMEGFGSPVNKLQQLAQENQSLQAKAVYSERQLQVEHAAQISLAKELAVLQDEGMQLKEDVAFYKSILAESDGTGVLKFHSFKLAKGAQAGQYEYHILLVQSGRHDKTVQGNLKLNLSGLQDGKPVTVAVAANDGPPALKVNFKYYQRLDGSFTLPKGVTGQTLEADFLEMGSNQPKISEAVNLPG
jgi:hypothetical protein